MKNGAVLLDTSFFLRLFDTECSLHQNAKGYFRYFLENGIVMKISTIAIAEFCVKGELTDLPLINLQVIPFNILHATKAGNFMRIDYETKISNSSSYPRFVVKNDIKMLAQADVDSTIVGFVSSDVNAIKIYERIKSAIDINFEYIDITIPYNQRYGILDLQLG